MYAVIAENDESQWNDDTGILYHFPVTYQKFLTPGTRVIYYKGRLSNPVYRGSRLSTEPHYFGFATIGNVFQDKKSKRKLFATIYDYEELTEAISFKSEIGYLEEIPENKKANYWRNGVRLISEETYYKIRNQADPSHILNPRENQISVIEENLDFESYSEGDKKEKYITFYERNTRLRKQAIAIHGDSCFACGFNFGEVYGEYATGFIHIHHTTPISQIKKNKLVNPETDLIPLCANCHSVVHRKKEHTLTLMELRNMIKRAV